MMRTCCTLLALMVAAIAAGCDGASSARETVRVATASTATPGSDESPIATPANDQPLEGAPPAADAPSSSASIVETTFDDIKFPMEKTDDFAESLLSDGVKNLFGKRIRIRGYMYPTPRRKGIKQFVLVRDNMECCFGPGAALFDCILVTMMGDATAEFTIRPIAVEGEFRLEILPGPDGRPLAIYQMAGEAAG